MSSQHSSNKLNDAKKTHGNAAAKLREQLETEKSEAERKLQEEKDGRAADKEEYEVCFQWTF